jgi:hypothetical protein
MKQPYQCSQLLVGVCSGRVCVCSYAGASGSRNPGSSISDGGFELGCLTLLLDDPLGAS